jgi:hypothetical protein
MAFCPECGKAVTPDEAACSSCGKQLRSSEKKARAGRFHGTMMITAPEAKSEPPANINAQRPSEQAALVASAAGMTSSRSSMPASGKRSSLPPSAKQGGNLAPNTSAPSLGRAAPSPQLKATMIGAGSAPTHAAQKPAPKHATMLGAAHTSTTPSSKPPGASLQPKPSVAPQAKSGPAQPLAKSERPPVVRQTSPHASSSPSVRAVQSVPVSPASETESTAPAQASVSGQVLHDAQTIPSPMPPRGSESRSPNPARMVQAIPEVDATVVDASELSNNMRTVPREYLPGDPMAPQPPAAMRAPRLREHPFAPADPEQEGQGNYVMLYWAVCVAVVAAATALAFRLF